MAELNNSGSGQWSEVDASNTSPSPNGWPANTFFNQVESIGQSTMGAIKRFWNRTNGTVTTTGASGTYTYTPVNTSFPTVYEQGEVYSFKADKDGAGNDVININSLGTRKIYKSDPTGIIRVAAGDIKTGAHIVGQIDTNLDSGNGGFFITGGLAVTIPTPVSVVSFIANSLGSDVLLNNTGNYFDGPSVAQGTVGTWFVSGTITLIDTSGAGNFLAKLWDGTTVIASTVTQSRTTSAEISVSLSGYMASPAGNLRISARDVSSTNGKILCNDSGNSKDSTITAVRLI